MLLHVPVATQLLLSLPVSITRQLLQKNQSRPALSQSPDQRYQKQSSALVYLCEKIVLLMRDPDNFRSLFQCRLNLWHKRYPGQVIGINYLLRQSALQYKVHRHKYQKHTWNEPMKSSRLFWHHAEEWSWDVIVVHQIIYRFPVQTEISELSMHFHRL